MLDINQRKVAYALFVGGNLVFNYAKDGKVTQRKLQTVTDIKFNNEDDILIGGWIYNNDDVNDYQYRQFFLEQMSSVDVFKRIDVAEMSQ
jgi:hypothetical protein|tara:strand:+ start:1154 stop:1423 length:270 start_codon:yes stop_codon:yes gene_type:complete